MNLKAVLTAESEAKRFLERVEALNLDLKAEMKTSLYNESERMYFMRGSRATGALKRSSLDLSQALAKIRK